MKKSKLLPTNKRYAAALCGFLALTCLYFIFIDPIQVAVMGDRTLRGHPIVKMDDKVMLWAKGDPESDSAEWFDVTDSRIDPRRFNHGIGKDRIASIDDPRFVSPSDDDFDLNNFSGSMQVIGYAAGGEAKAYPLRIMNFHEIVNDTFGDAHLTVAW